LLCLLCRLLFRIQSFFLHNLRCWVLLCRKLLVMYILFGGQLFKCGVGLMHNLPDWELFAVCGLVVLSLLCWGNICLDYWVNRL
jgi:hypothetical protein